MTNWLIKRFVPAGARPGSPELHAAVGTLAGGTGIACNSLLFLAKLAVGLVSGSVSIVADALNNLSDASSSVVTLLGFRMAQQPADEHHPYGHARYEYLSGLVVAALILLVGAELVRSSVDKIFHPAAVEVSAVTVAVLLASIGVKLWMWRFFAGLGKRIGSTALLATAADSRNDVIASGAVVLGCLARWAFEVNVDGVVGLGVAGFILFSGVDLAKETVSPLLGQQVDHDLVRKISELVESHQPVLGIHDLLVHDYGPGRYYASVHAEISAQVDPLECHDIIDDIESDALEQLGVHLVIHYDPVVLDDPEENRIRELVARVVENVDCRLSVHDFRMIRGAKQTKLAFDLMVPYSIYDRRRELKDEIDRALAAGGENYATRIQFDGKPG